MTFSRALGRTLGRFLAPTVVIALAAAGLTSPGVAAAADTTPPAGYPATVAADALPTWQINGVVLSQVIVNNIVYATGRFTRARPPGVAAGGAGEVPAGNIFAYDVRTGNRIATFNHSLNAQGRAITASPDGSRIYVGGDFTAVDGKARGHLAAFVTATGALDTAFHPAVNSKVMALSASTSYLFFGGVFQVVNTSLRKNLAAVRRSDGSVLSWAPSVDNGAVWSMVVAPDSSRLIVGGSFTTIGGKSAYGMGSVSIATGGLLPWAANKTIKDATDTGAITSLRTDGHQIYGSGYALGAGSSFEGTFAANPLTGAITVLNDCHGDTYDLAPIGRVLYSVGHVHDCRAIHGFPDINPRYNSQRALAQTIEPKTTNVGPDVYGWNFNGWPASAILHWFPNLAPGTITGQSQAAWSVAGNSDYVVLGGEFPTVNGRAQQGLVRTAIAAKSTNKLGPSYKTKASTTTIPPTTASSPAPGKVTVTFGTAWDYDNASLTYELIRDSSTVVYRTTIATNWWTLPKKSFTDSGLPVGSSHTYQVRIKDPFGNTLLSPRSNTVTS